MRYRLEIVGQMPLLMHKDDVEAADEVSAERDRIKEEQGKLFKGGDDRVPAWVWMTYLYHDGVNVGIPFDNVKAAIAWGARKVPQGNRGSNYERDVQGLIDFDDLFLKFTYGDGKTLAMADVVKLRDLPFRAQAEAAKKLGFSLFVKRAAVAGRKHVRVRARFETWRCGGVFEVHDDSILTREILDKIVKHAGRGGACDWRASSKRPGPYGRFEAKITKA